MAFEDLIGGNIVGLLHHPGDYAAPRPGLRSLWRRHLIANAFVRNREYMVALFKSHFPGSPTVEATDGRVPEDSIAGADAIVLLYPDSIGMDFGWIERTVRARWPAKRLLVLNGRRRFFRLDAEMRRRLALRRFLERARLPEFAFFALFLVVTPVLLLLDAFKSSR